MTKPALLKLIRALLRELRSFIVYEDKTCTCRRCTIMRKAARVLKEATR